jgi:hypothetical protein
MVTEYSNAADGVTGLVTVRQDGRLAVVLRDDDSGEVVSHVEILPANREAEAHALARKWANV